MAQDIVGGLFGPQPWEIDQARQQALAQAADKYAAQKPMEQAMGLLYRGGAGLAQTGAGMLGMEDPAIAQAQARQQALGGLDVSSPESIMAAAQRTADPQLRMRLMMMARQMQTEAQKQQADTIKMKLDEARAERERAMAERALRGEPEMKYAPEVQKLMALRDSLPESDPRRATLDAAIRKATYIKPENGGAAGMTAGELRQQKYEDQKEKAAIEKRDAAQSGLDAFANIKRNIEDLYDPVNKRLKPNAMALFGRLDQYRPAVTMSEGGANALSSLTALKDQITMTNLAEAKARVGQSFGSMQVQEWDKFVRIITSLDRSMGEAKAAENLKYMLDFIDKKSGVLKAALEAPNAKAPAASFEARTPEDVRRLFREGKLSREEAKAILTDMGM